MVRIQTDLNAGEGVPDYNDGFLLLASQGAFQHCLRVYVYCSLLNVLKKTEGVYLSHGPETIFWNL